MELVYEWIYSISTVQQLMTRTGHARQTIIDWSNLMRQVCTLSINSQPKYRGTVLSPIQIHESTFSGRRKYNRGRLRAGDRRPKNESLLRSQDPSYLRYTNLGVASGRIKKKGRKNRDSQRIGGKWVFGAYAGPNHVRFRVVQNRTAANLIPTIEDWVEKGSVIVSDGWGAYINLEQYNYRHKQVIHEKEFVTEDGWHTVVVNF